MDSFILDKGIIDSEVEVEFELPFAFELTIRGVVGRKVLLEDAGGNLIECYQLDYGSDVLKDLYGKDPLVDLKLVNLYKKDES